MINAIDNSIRTKIYEIDGKRVMLDFDLAALYNVETKHVNQAVRRNLNRFPEDFYFQLSPEAHNNLKSQFVTSSWGGKRKLPMAFTEHGIAMLASVLRSETAIRMNLAIIRTFIALRELASEHLEIHQKISELEQKYDRKFSSINQALDYLLNEKQAEELQKKRRKIGFNATKIHHHSKVKRSQGKS